MLILTPIYPIFLVMWENILQELSKTYQISLKLLVDVKYHVAQFVQLDLGLESHLQLVLSMFQKLMHCLVY